MCTAGCRWTWSDERRDVIRKEGASADNNYVARPTEQLLVSAARALFGQVLPHNLLFVSDGDFQKSFEKKRG